ncbi:hypothetical protein [Candidatus Nitrosotalea bavarica]|uniref:hypothetical protein n=1 Tax=Candidatus Nitrosotalea bavarica TaxID=1903277 RepID=UPI000C71366B|nr:hypothetical protein [Candidatus Nitrosotalea bavarica]
MTKKIVASLMVIALVGVLFVHPVFAHSFVKNSDADLIAKIQEFKVESKLIANNISDSKMSHWHIAKSQEYWGLNDMNTLTQQNATLANSLSTAINDLYSLSGSTNVDPTIASQKSYALNQLLDQVESTEISASIQNNATVKSLAIINVLNQVLVDYGDAIGSNVDLTNMANMNMSSMSMNNSSSVSSGSMSGMKGMSGMQSGSMSGMSGMSSIIVDEAAYQSAQELTTTAQSMFQDLNSMAPSSTSSYLDKIGTALGNLQQAIGAKESGNNVMMIVHMYIHPNFISGLNIQVVPEFPMPILLVMLSFISVIIITKALPKIR